MKIGDIVICHNFHYGEILHNLNNSLPMCKFTIYNEYTIDEVYKDGYDINGTFFYDESDKMNTFYWAKFFWSKKNILNKKIKKVRESR